MKGYGQFCPVAKATEVLGEKWTPLIIRELLSDDQSFNMLRKGVPLMSPSLLSVESLGVWGQRWARSDLSKKDLDPSLLMWDMHRRIDTSYFPEGRTVLRFEYVDYPSKMRLWWLVVTDDGVDICLKDPGHEVDLFVQTRLKTMTQIWIGDMSVSKARREKRLNLSGNTALKNSMPSWLGCSLLAGVAPATGRNAARA
jgi:hypothetical protein